MHLQGGVEVFAQRVVGRALLLSLLLVASVEAPAHAYIDGGSATVMFQALVAGAAAAGLSLRLSWRKLTGRTRRSANAASDSVDGSPEQDAEIAGDDRT
jgi:hypothetical protein